MEVIAATIVLGLECGSLACGAIGLLGKLISRKLEIKSKKHNEIRLLAETKLNTISSYISAAVADENIDDVEYKLILDEMTKFGDMKNNIQSKNSKDYSEIDERMKTDLIEEGKKMGKAELIKKLGS